jgi:hypothetical protein
MSPVILSEAASSLAKKRRVEGPLDSHAASPSLKIGRGATDLSSAQHDKEIVVPAINHVPFSRLLSR